MDITVRLRALPSFFKKIPMNLRGVSLRSIVILVSFLLILIEFCVVFTALSQNGSIYALFLEHVRVVGLKIG